MNPLKLRLFSLVGFRPTADVSILEIISIDFAITVCAALAALLLSLTALLVI
jgi:hypothetical protein